MALTANRVCDCGTEKKLAPNGLLHCLHCDGSICTGVNCPLCESYREGLIKRVILRCYKSA